MNSGILTYLFALRLYSDHLTKRFRILQAQYCDLSCRLYDTLERPRASQRAALWLGWWCTGCEGSKWSSLEFCHRDKKVGLFFFFFFIIFCFFRYKIYLHCQFSSGSTKDVYTREITFKTITVVHKKFIITTSGH